MKTGSRVRESVMSREGIDPHDARPKTVPLTG